jgi:hypothetical protein
MRCRLRRWQGRDLASGNAQVMKRQESRAWHEESGFQLLDGETRPGEQPVGPLI